MSARLSTALAILLLAAVTSLHAGADFGLGLRIGTQGAGAELGVGLGKRVGIRGGYYAGEVSGDYEETDIDYEGELTLGGPGLLVDFHPMKGSFRLSAGMFSNKNAIDLEGVATADREIGDATYTPDEIGTLTGEIDFDDTAPYFGIGWGRLTGNKRLGFLVDLGALKQGSGDVTVSSSTGLIAEEDLEAEAAEIEEDIESYEFWPVLSFGLAIRF
jgi:hypothetical protein